MNINLYHHALRKSWLFIKGGSTDCMAFSSKAEKSIRGGVHLITANLAKYE